MALTDDIMLLAHVRQLGEWWRAALASTGNPLVGTVRGEGLLIAVELTAPVAAAVAARALEAGFIVNPCTPTTLRLAPPYVLTQDQAQTFVDFVAGLPTEVTA